MTTALRSNVAGIARAGAALVLAVACGCTSPLPNIAPGAEGRLAAPLDSDEAGFWMQMERIEKDVATAGHRVRDPELEAYLRDVACRMSPDYCEAIRIYVFQQPGFNAQMFPNGAMIVWTGLLLRAHNEAQLATVLGHEIGHYQRRHTLASWRRARQTSDAFAVFALAAAGAAPFTGGLSGAAADLAQLAAIGTLFAYSREQEAESDAIGVEQLARAGYDPREAVKLWEGVIAEDEADEDDDQPLGFFATHPSPPARREEIERLAAPLVTAENTGQVHAEEYRVRVARLRQRLLAEELSLREFERTEVVLDRLQASGNAPPGEIEYYRAELYRTRGEEGDVERAIAHYREAVGSGSAPAEVHRSLGLLLRRTGDAAGAREELAAYLERAPAASDRAMVEVYLQELGR